MLENILVQGVCPLKIKITQFSNGFCLKYFHCSEEIISTSKL